MTQATDAPKQPRLRKFLVIGLYDDDDQRFGEAVWAISPEAAEELCRIDHPGLTVAGVLDVKGKIVA